MITIENLRFNAVGIRSLVIGPGTTSIIGPNGSGKTTLLKILAGIVLPDSGSVLIDGVPPGRSIRDGSTSFLTGTSCLRGWKMRSRPLSDSAGQHAMRSIVRSRFV